MPNFHKGFKDVDMGQDFEVDDLDIMLPKGWRLERRRGVQDRYFYRATDGETVVSSPCFQNVLMRTMLREDFGQDVEWKRSKPQRWVAVKIANAQ